MFLYLNKSNSAGEFETKSQVASNNEDQNNPT
jgi:hypothetical protein